MRSKHGLFQNAAMVGNLPKLPIEAWLEAQQTLTAVPKDANR